MTLQGILKWSYGKGARYLPLSRSLIELNMENNFVHPSSTTISTQVHNFCQASLNLYPPPTRISSRFLSTARRIKPPPSLELEYRRTTDKFLNRNQHPLGSLDSLEWHTAECLILYWATVETSEGISKALGLLERLVQDSETNSEEHCKVDIYIIHAILKAWKTLLRSSKTPLLPSELLDKVDHFASSGCIQPNIATYTMIIDGASHCSDPEQRVELTQSLFQRLLQQSKTNHELQPTFFTVSTVINALSKSGNKVSAQKAEDLLNELQQMYETEGTQSLRPNAVVYTSVISAWGKAGDPERAQALFRTMYQEYLVNDNQEMKPTTRTLNAVIDAWARSRHPSSFENAEALLRWAWEKRNELELTPDTISYNILVNALSRRPGIDAVNKGEALVAEMLDRSDHHKQVQPNETTFSSLVKLISTSRIPNSSDRISHWVKKMEGLGLPVNSFIRRTLGQ